MNVQQENQTMNTHRDLLQVNRVLRSGVAVAALGWCLALGAAPVAAAGDGSALRTAIAQSGQAQTSYIADASIEAVRDSRIAAQVAGRITDLSVQAGDHVQAGQVLMHIDPSMAAQQVAGSQAQVAQAQAMLTAARADLDRAKRLYAKEYLSKAALDHAQAQFQSAEAQARALTAQAAATNVQAGYYTVRAPYSGWVAQVSVAVGDMAAPGLPLVALYDPAALRVTVQLPETVVGRLDRTAPAVVELTNLPADAPAAARRQTVSRINVLPALDAATHSATVRIDLPAQPASVLPGQFARVRFTLKSAEPTAGTAIARVLVPRSAVVQRGELSAVYVVNAQGQAQLRQVRLGRENGEQVEVLAGVAVGEKVALDPVAAAQAEVR
jgi:multidrug efflux system membrane fusion protein